jgi:hypothetical protein
MNGSFFILYKFIARFHSGDLGQSLHFSPRLSNMSHRIFAMMNKIRRRIMSARRILPVLVFSLGILFAACSPGALSSGDKIIGRWELFYNDELTSGIVFELYPDGTGAAFTFTSVRAFDYPPIVGSITYTYDPANGLLEMKPADDPSGMMRTNTFKVTFVSEDEITLDDQITSKVEELPYLRTPLPETPIGVRSRLGNLLLPEGRSLVSIERLDGDWQDQYPGYVEADIVDGEAVANNPEQWLAVIQQEGEVEPRLYLLIEGRSYRWEMVRLEKK